MHTGCGTQQAHSPGVQQCVQGGGCRCGATGRFADAKQAKISSDGIHFLRDRDKSKGLTQLSAKVQEVEWMLGERQTNGRKQISQSAEMSHDREMQ